MGGVPIGRRNLFSERRRAILGIAGVGVALLLVLALDGIFAGSMRQLSRYIDTSPADVFASQRGVRTMHMSSSSLRLAAVDEIRELPGVRWADPILFASDALEASSARQLSYIFGYVPGHRGGPTSLVEGIEPGPGEIVLDDRGAASLGLSVGDRVDALGRSWRISGLTSGLTNIANTVAFVGFRDFEAARRVEGVASYILVGTSGSSDEAARRIQAATGLTAQTRATFSAEERGVVKDMSAELMQIMTLAALLIGLAVVGLTLYAATLSRLREIGVMKALGAGSRRLSVIVLSQAAWTVGAALTLAVPVALGLGVLAERASGNVSIVVEPASVLRAAVGAAVLGGLGAVVPLIKVSRVDPATVFRR